MTWKRIKSLSGFHFDVDYTLKDYEKDNYTLVTIREIRLSTYNNYRVYNDYPVGHPLCTVMGVGINTTKKTQDVLLGTIGTNSTRTYNIHDLAVKVPHDKRSGAAKCDLSIYVNTKTDYGNINWASASITLKTFDRSAAKVSGRISGKTNSSLSVEASINKDVSKISYNLNGGKWTSIGSAKAGKKIFSISSLQPNTNYTIGLKVVNNRNNVESSTTCSGRTDADPSTISNVTFSEVTSNSIKASISSNVSKNNEPVYFLYSLDNTNFEKLTSSTFVIDKLASNTTYTFYFKEQSKNNKFSPVISKSIKTLPKPPVIESVSFVRGSKSIKCKVDNIRCEAGVKTFIYYLNGTEKGRNTSGSFIYDNLESNTQYMIKIKIIDNASEEYSYTEKIITNAILSDNFTVIATTLSSSSVEVLISEVQSQLPIEEVTLDFYRQGNLEVRKILTTLSWTQKGLKENTEYNLKVTLKDRNGNISTHRPISLITWKKPPEIKEIKLDSLTEKSCTLSVIPSRVNEDISKMIFSFNGVKKVVEGSQIQLTALTPNVEYSIIISLQDIHGQEGPSKYFTFKTLEDRWIYLSKNGGSFKKVKVQLISSSSNYEIRRSQIKIIKGGDQ